MGTGEYKAYFEEKNESKKPMTNTENLKIMFELKQEDKSNTMLFNSLILLLNEYKFHNEQMEIGIPTTKDIEVKNDMLDRAKAIIDLMKVEVKV